MMLPGAPSGFIEAGISNVELFEQAAVACSRRHGCTPAEILRRLDEGDRSVHSTFRYGVAKALSAYLASLGSVFHGVYVYGSAIGESSGPASDIDLIVVVSRRRDELTSFLKRLDLTLVSGYRRLVRDGCTIASLLDVKIVDQKEQEERSGFGALLDGVHTRPICLWRSNPAIAGGSPKGGPPRSLHPLSESATVRTR